jgi:hypothetical protein
LKTQAEIIINAFTEVLDAERERQSPAASSTEGICQSVHQGVSG